MPSADDVRRTLDVLARMPSAPPGSAPLTAAASCAAFLRELLTERPVGAHKARELTRILGYGWRAHYAACQLLGLTRTRLGFGGRVLLSLPTCPAMAVA